MADVLFELGLKVLYIGPGLVLGVILGKWGLFKRFPTVPLCAAVAAVTTIAGIADVLTWNLTDFYWLGLPFWAPLYLWLARKPVTEKTVSAVGVGPASRAFEPRRHS